MLRVLETERVRRLGATSENATSFRLVVSVQRPAADLVTAGRWRSDFYYRVAGLRLRVPSLVERRSDIPLIANHLAGVLGACRLADDDLDALQAHDWPGNVRELRRVLERALCSVRGRALRGEDLCAAIECIQPAGDSAADSGRTLRESLQKTERQHFEQVLARTGDDWRAATRALGISKSTFYRKLEALGLVNRSATRRPEPR